MQIFSWNRLRFVLFTLAGVLFIFSGGGSAKLTPAPQGAKSDTPRIKTEKEDPARQLQRALASTEVVTAIIELQSDSVVVHEKKLNVATKRDSKIRLDVPEAIAYESQLATEQENFKALARQLAPNLHVITEVRAILNAISIEAPGTDIAAIATLPGVKRIQLTREYHATLNRSIPLINAPAAWTSVGGSGSAGQGIKIAILDTGIDITNPLFADAGFTAPAGFPKGNTSFTNNKVIAAKAFLASGSTSPQDQNGHGTNVAGIAAGDFNTASPLAPISGVAPRAFLGNYRVLDANGSGRDDLIIQGLQAALQDGFDVASMSLGAPALSTLDALDQAVENAVAAGMIVTVAAGNSGEDGAMSIESPGLAPSAITVASSTNSHVVGPGASLTVSGSVPSNLMNIGGTIGHGGAASSALTSTIGPAQYADVNALDGNNRACSGLNSGSLTGKIALIERGLCTFAVKVANANGAGASAVIMYNKDVSEGSDGGDVIITMDVSGPPAAQIPSVFIGRTNGLALRDWASSHPGAQVSMTPVALLELSNSTDVISSFSSRGPSPILGLKPDLAAPGDPVYSGAIKTNNPNGVSDPSGFAAVSGTSQATPHIAGAAALLKQLHPSWTPLQIKSALISSANNSVFGDSTKTASAGVLDAGSGRADLAVASAVKATFSPASLSFPTISVGTQSFHESLDLQITNQSGGANTYSISAQNLSSGVTVSPSVNSVSPAAGQSSTLNINLTAGGGTGAGDFTGYVVVTDQTNQRLRVPYWVRILPPPTVQFVSPTYSVTEGGVAQVQVNRFGDASTPISVDYATSDDTASQRTRYITSSGTLTFAAGQTVQSFNVITIDDGYVEDAQRFKVTLSNSTGANLGSPSVAFVSIDDNDEAPASTNPLDNAPYFVTQQYYDFLNRVPDSGGLQFWTSQIAGNANNNPAPCANGDNACLLARRIVVSNAFFYEPEFQQTGSYAYRLYRAAFGNTQPFPNSDANNPKLPEAQQAEARKLPTYSVFATDRARVIGGADLATGQQNLANAFVQRDEFLTKYPASQDGPAFVDAVLATIKNDLGVDLTSQRAALITLFGSGGRGAVMYRLANDDGQGSNGGINNRALIDEEYNRAFVATEYFGYLRRDSDIGGYLFWLGQVSRYPLRNGDAQHAMVCSFITSKEYQLRFSPVAPHSNSECPQ
jgi:minor extracellular serine protease Vpr